MATCKIKDKLNNCQCKLISQCLFGGVLKVSSGNQNNFRCFLMVPPRGFLFMHFCGDFASKCGKLVCVCVFLCVENAP